MFKVFVLFSLIFGLMSYINLDLMKSSFFLIFSLLVSILVLSFGLNIWYSYFVCLLFLSGIFVILVYFSSLSSLSFNKSYFLLFCMILSLYFLSLLLIWQSSSLNLVNFYYYSYLILVIFSLIMLLYFMNFCSYYLNFSGALRKV